jgi:hypothetical protein
MISLITHSKDVFDYIFDWFVIITGVVFISIGLYKLIICIPIYIRSFSGFSFMEILKKLCRDIGTVILCVIAILFMILSVLVTS